MKAIMQTEGIKHLQDRGMIFWAIILPILFTVLFISLFTSGVEESMKEEVIISIVPGYVVMFIFFIMISMVTTFIKDKEGGMVARIASTPISSIAFLLGKWMPFIFIVFIQIAILFTFGKIVYHIPLGNPLYIVIISLFITFAVTGLGLALALFVRSENMGIACTQIIALGGAMLGGLWMPIDTMPSIVQTIAKVTPQYWAHQAYQGAMTDTLSGGDLLLSLFILFLYGSIGCLLAYIRYPRFLNEAKH